MKVTAAVCVLLCALICATEASISSSKLWDRFRSAYLRRRATNACKSVAGTVSGTRHFVHVCERDEGSGVCVTSKLRRCCPGGNIWNCTKPVSSTYLRVGRNYERVSVTLYPVQEGRSESICYLLDESHQNKLVSCGDCKDEGCKTKDTLITRCMENVADDELECNADTNRRLRCQEGYKPPSCCSCDDGYVQMYGKCIRFCSANCKERDGYPYGSGCNECRPGYLAPDCCDCADNYYRSDDGGCKAICTENALECSENGCTKCKEGHKGQGCCERELSKVCKINCIGERPDGTCTRCHNDASLLPHCCLCHENYNKTQTGECELIPLPQRVCEKNCDGRRLDGTCDKCTDRRLQSPYCCDCVNGFEPTEKGECRSMTCMENCQKKNRFNGSCDQCYEGYANPFCCTCDEGFDKMLNGDCEIRSVVMEDIVEAVEEALRDALQKE